MPLEPSPSPSEAAKQAPKGEINSSDTIKLSINDATKAHQVDSPKPKNLIAEGKILQLSELPEFRKTNPDSVICTFQGGLATSADDAELNSTVVSQSVGKDKTARTALIQLINLKLESKPMAWLTCSRYSKIDSPILWEEVETALNGFFKIEKQ